MIDFLNLKNLISYFFNGDTGINGLIESWLVVFTITVLLCFVVGEITRNYSQVDKLWSLMPFIYSALTISHFPDSPRLWIMTILVLLWGIRLSYNFYRKGGYQFPPWKGEEDYRWAVLRKVPMLKGYRYSFFNLFFISFYQHFLIMLFNAPLLLAALNAKSPLDGFDLLASAAMLLFIIIETIADNQLYEFHEQKKGNQPANGKYTHSLTRGFMVDGMWKVVRHPNYVAEQLIWVSFYFFGVAATGNLLNWTLAGAILLIILFIGSSSITENISFSKYPDYASYKQKVPRYLPGIFKRKRE